MGSKMPKKKNKKIKERNWIAVSAHFKTRAGAHQDKKKQASKKACRKKYNKVED